MRNDFDDYCPASVSRGELEDIASITVRLMPYYGRDIEKMRDMPREQAVAYRQELREKGMFYDAAKAVDIYSHGNFCASHLSNFCKTDFIFEGINIKSMEGFLQSLKTSNQEEQIHICSLAGKEAKKAGLAVAGFDGKHLYWQGETIDRFSEQYHVLVRRAYHARFEQDNLFRKALMEAKNKQLLHTIGNNDPKVTILTVDEFIGFLQELQEKL
ncbi:hypothetical protein DPQ25_00640 [Hydrogeniiclostridium mannosilyticum]|uniref:Uncharacterized protein n=1 Tax=Hydrogeniiclostridium mannosilyticum TaxID=2764322 RepID=A0A328UIG3_9FIRM|nr:hypothetical protein [Hydrogeniiclostridium mannosilyticum]RAQ30050.1 hypothetical protein DPQ25_00640 [Hydrogeniiclostridium mannosilyticum]